MARFAVTYSGPPKSYKNRGVTKKYIAIHNTSNNAPPANEASYAKNRNDGVSSHFYADANTVIQSLDTRYDANHAGSYEGNARAIAFELVGTNSSTDAYWRKVIDRVAPVIAAVCKQHSISPRDMTVAEMKAGALTGIVTHDEMRRAWGGTTHTDPGPNFPMAYLIQQVNKILNPSKPVSVPAPVSNGANTIKFSVALKAVGEGDSDAKLPGYNMIARIQKLSGLSGKDVDGVWGPKTTAALSATIKVPGTKRMTEGAYRVLFGLESE
ncbi:N-acetylmuramoyl-L-alanine amidase [Actinoplanes sp. CA-054009]